VIAHQHEAHWTNPKSFSSIFPLESSIDSTIRILLEFQRPALASLLATPLGGERRDIYPMAAVASTEFLNSFDLAVSGLLAGVSAVEPRGIYGMTAVVSSKFRTRSNRPFPACPLTFPLVGATTSMRWPRWCQPSF
jgi:hypothetical protein